MKQRGAQMAMFLIVALAACQAPPTPLPSASAVLDQTAQTLQALRAVHFTLEREGAPAYVDPQHTFIFRRVEGDFVAPDQARATVRVIGPALVAEVHVVALGEQYWETNPLTGEWGNYSGYGYNPAALFHPDTGLAALLRGPLTDLTLTGLEARADYPGEKIFHLTASASGEPLQAMTAGLIGRGPVKLEWWIDPNTYQLLELHITEPDTDPQDPTRWVVTFDQFDAALLIEPPVMRN